MTAPGLRKIKASLSHSTGLVGIKLFKFISFYFVFSLHLYLLSYNPRRNLSISPKKYLLWCLFENKWSYFQKRLSIFWGKKNPIVKPYKGKSVIYLRQNLIWNKKTQIIFIVVLFDKLVFWIYESTMLQIFEILFSKVC